MASSPYRSAHYGDELVPIDTQLPVLDVAPLNIMPHGAPPSSPFNLVAGETQSEPNRELLENALASTSTGVEAELTGSAATGKVGPIIGLVDIGESAESYMFRVSLPGVARYHGDFKCQIEANGKITIEGVTTTGEKTVYKNHQKFEMLSVNLCPPGHFSISFQLPGPVNHHQFSGLFGDDGTFAGIVKKS